jgi:hypothetical protein
MMSWQYATGLVTLVSPVWDLCMHGGQAAAGAQVTLLTQSRVGID